MNRRVGEQVTSYLSDSAARVDLPEGKRGVIESSEPMAVENSPGQRMPVDLGLGESGGSFVLARPAVALSIPKWLQEGVGLAGFGVSLTPVDASGAAVGGSEGSVDGAVAFYGGVEVGSDVDVIVKPVTAGFEEDVLLRSVRSPQQLSFRLGLPEGATVRQGSGGSGPVEVVEAGQVLAVVLPPLAVDAAGTPVPVTMGVSGDTLTLSVDEHAGEYEYPIMVDPTVTDSQLFESQYGFASNWKVYPEQPSPFHFAEEEDNGYLLDWDTNTAYTRGESGEMTYETRKNTRIYKFVAETSASNLSGTIENAVSVRSEKGGVEKDEALGDNYSSTKRELCVESGCATGTVSEINEGNAAEFKQTATSSGSTSFESKLLSASVSILQEKGPTVSVNTSSEMIGGRRNIFYPGNWSGSSVPRGSEVTGTDPGLGIYHFLLASSYEPVREVLSPAEICHGMQCPQSLTSVDEVMNNPGELPNGDDTVEVSSEDPVGLKATVDAKVKVDKTVPYNVTLSGLPPDGELSNTKQYSLKATAQDGTTSETSGIESIGLKIDGKEVGKASGSCSPGPCTGKSSEWLISGSEYANGQHTVTVTATSYSGEVTRKEYTVSVGHKAVPVALGPGSINPETGEFFLSSTDVSIGGPGATLSVKRNYASAALTAGAEGPLGPQWDMSVGGTEGLTTFEGGVVLTGGEGQTSVFTSKGGGEFSSPPDAASVKLTEVLEKEKTKEFLLKGADGTVTKFTLPSGGTGTTWVPSTSEGPAATNLVTYKFKTVSGITEPTEVLGPVPTGVSCTAESVSELVKGCRALGFVYSMKTTATGDGSSEWGEYEGHLKEVTFTAWEPTASKMTTTAVAQYSYDKQGQLRAEWDPRISPALKTTYGYDSEGHVTAITPPGSQPALLTYGTIPNDIRSGRVLAVTRPAASTAAGDGVAPVNTTAPALSTTSPVEGSTVSVSTGSWSNSPLSYAYQWEECDTETKTEECWPILGETNPTYTPTTNRTYPLQVEVTATNSDGSVTVTSNKSNKVAITNFFEDKIKFGTSGSGKLSKPMAAAVDFSEDAWVTDTGNHRVVEFSSTGTFIAAYGWGVTNGKEEFQTCTGSSCLAGLSGSKEGEFKEPTGITIGKNGYIYVADSGNTRIEVLSSTGKYVTEKTTTAAPAGIAIGKVIHEHKEHEELYVVEPSDDAIQTFEVGESGALYNQGSFGKEGTGDGQFKDPTAVTTGDAPYITGNYIYVSDTGNDRVEVFKPLGTLGIVEYNSQFGKEGNGEGQFSSPGRLAFEPEGLEGQYDSPLAGRLFVTDTGNNRVQEFANNGYYEHQYTLGSGAQGIAFNTGKGASAGDMYLASSTESAVVEWVPVGPPNPLPEPPKPGTSAVTTVDYNVPVSGSGAPYAMGKSELEAWDQKDDPTEATAIFPPDEPMGWPAKDYKRATIYYLDGNGRQVNVASPGGGISTSEYNTQGDVVRALSAENRALALGQRPISKELAAEHDTENTYNTEGTELDSTLGPQHTVKLSSGSTVEARDHKQYSYEEGAPAEGGPYGLPTKTTEGAEYSGKEEDIRETTTSYSGQENLGWKLHKPTSVTTDPKGLKLTHTIVYEPSTGEVKETVMPAGNPKEKTAHATETIYYTAAKNTTVPACGEHPEWANLPCQTQPSKQPETSGLPNLPLTTTTYNMWDEPAKTTEAVGSTTRSKTATYDTAGRPKTSAINSTVGTALPTVTDEYNKETGALEKQCANEGKACTEGKPKTITSAYNALGEMTSYADSDENTATYEYDIDGRTTKVNDGKGTQTYTYETTTGDLTKLVDLAAGTFTATYNTEGNLQTEGYPNGMTATYTYNQVGKPTALVYKKTTNCAEEEKEKCKWFKDTVVPSIHGQWLEQTSTLSHQAYTYDTDGRLTQVQNTPAGKGCTTRVYAYDEDTNRTSLTTREPGSEGKCATEGGIVEKHSYDTADRLTDTGTSYSTFGDITALPAADAGGSELTSAYYVDNQLAGQTQNGETIGYNLDPSGRTRETVSTGKTSQDIINHYAAGGDTPAWTIETPSGNWTRDIKGIGGGLAAIQVNGETPVLQLTDLHGDIIATAALSETETKLLSMTDTSEYGVPTTSAPAKYSWLGAEQQPTELPSGVIAMGARSYVSQVGRFLQTDPIPGGSADAYAYTFGDPVNTSDPSGELTYGISGWLLAANNQQDQEVIARETAREALERAEAERRIRETEAAEQAAGPQYAGPEGPLGGSEGWACEYAAETGQEGEGCGGGGSAGGGGAYRNLEDPATGCTAYGAPGCKNSKGNEHIAHEKCPKSSGRCSSGGTGNEGSENLHKACIIFFWTPYGLLCGAYEAGKYLGEHT